MYDVNENASYCNYGAGKIIADHDDYAYYGKLWDGFKTGIVKLEVDSSTIGASITFKYNMETEIFNSTDKESFFGFIYDLIIYNSYSTGEDAVIWTELSNITMCNVVFTNNLANSPGGIILTEGGTFKLINSSIKNNLIDYNGGISGGIIYSECNLVIVNSSFVNNTIKSSTYSGGAIFAKGNLEFINSSMSHLYVVSDDIIQGAFIYYDANNILKDKGYIINSSFEKNNTLFSYISLIIALRLKGEVRFLIA